MLLKPDRSVSRSRRSWLALLALAGALAALTVPQLAPADTTAAPTGTLRIAEGLVQPTLDPATDIQFLSDELAAVYETLVTVLPGGKIAPNLATSWTVNKNAITFQLRKGVKFHDGTTFDAAAVKAELDRIANPKTQATNSKSVLGPYKNSKVLSPYSIRITWYAPYAGALIDLGNADLSIPSPKAAAAGILATHPVGTGPYKFVSYTPGTELVLEWNPDYKTGRTDLSNRGTPRYKQLVFQYVTDESTRANLLTTGAIDITRLDGTYAKSAMANPALKSYKFPSISEYWLALNSRKLTDKNVRKAIFAAVDRKALVAATAAGFADLNDSAIPTTIPGWDKSVTVTQYDPAQAKKLLAAAGYKLNSSGVMEKNGTELSFQILSPSQDPYPAMGQLIQDQLAQVGIKTNIVMQVQASVTLTRRQGNQGIYLGTYGILDPMGSMNILFGCAKIPSPANPLGTNITFWCNHQFDRDIIASQKLLGNEAARNVRLVRASKALADAHVSLTLFQPQTVVFAKKSIQGVALQPDGILKLNDLTPGT